MIIRLYLFVLLIAAGFGVNAATVNVDVDGFVESITNLEVGGVAYDATFHRGTTFDALWDNDKDGDFDDSDGSLFNRAPAFIDNSPLAQEAAETILGLLGSTHKTMSTYTDFDYFIIPYNHYFDAYYRYDAWYDGNGTLGTDYISVYGSKAAEVVSQAPFVSFSVSAVPIPATFWLLGSGLLGLIGFSKRKVANH